MEVPCRLFEALPAAAVMDFWRIVQFLMVSKCRGSDVGQKGSSTWSSDRWHAGIKVTAADTE